MNTPVKVIATRIDKNRGNVCVSRRAVLEKSKNAEIVEALNQLDIPVVMGSVIVIAFLFIIINIVVDLIYVYLDPRIKTL